MTWNMVRYDDYQCLLDKTWQGTSAITGIETKMTLSKYGQMRRPQHNLVKNSEKDNLIITTNKEVVGPGRLASDQEDRPFL